MTVMRESLGNNDGGMESVQYIRSTPKRHSCCHCSPVNNACVTMMVICFTPSVFNFLQHAISVCPVSIMSSTMITVGFTAPEIDESNTPVLVRRFLKDVIAPCISAACCTALHRSMAPSSGATMVASVNVRSMIIWANVSDSEIELIGIGMYSRSSSLCKLHVVMESI